MRTCIVIRRGVNLAGNCKPIHNFSGCWGVGCSPPRTSQGREFWSERHLSGFAANEKDLITSAHTQPNPGIVGGG